MKLLQRWVVIVAIISTALYLMYPLSEKIKLGLDLQGGIQLILSVDLDKSVESARDNLIQQLQRDLRNERISYSRIQPGGSIDSVVIRLTGRPGDKLEDYVTRNYRGILNPPVSTPRQLTYTFTDNYTSNSKRFAVEQSIVVIRNRVDAFGVNEPVIQKQGVDEIVVELPGIDNPERAVELIGRTAFLAFRLVNQSASQAAQRNPNFRPSGDEIIMYEDIVDPSTGKVTGSIPFVVSGTPLLTGSNLLDASTTVSRSNNEPAVSLTFDSTGAKIFGEVTSQNTGGVLAITLDDKVFSTPNINEPIYGGNAQISGAMNYTEAHDLAIVLRSGALPTKVVIEQDTTIGASLGEDSIRMGIRAIIVGTALVMLFVLVYYRLFGIVANIALILNFVLVMGALSVIGAALTLPGIAGLILTLGMAVDANVLIFERIREELRLGTPPEEAIDLGYAKAFSSIFDANVTTLIAALVLFSFGTGPVQGFAVTLSLGIIASMFTSIFITKTIIHSVIKRKTTISKLYI